MHSGASTNHAFYTVSTEGYFPGTVALLNSLRLSGNAGELIVLDVDLTPEQRALLRPHCTLASLPDLPETNPLLLKAYPAALQSAEVVVIVDSDIIVTRSLSEIVTAAARGQICVYPDWSSDRWFAEWADAFHLRAPLRRQTYVNSGFLAFSTRHWPELLARWRALSESIPPARTRGGGAARETPLWDGDQDALNALLMSEIPAEGVRLLPKDEAPAAEQERRQVEVVDADRLSCRYLGTPCRLVHASGTPKPWRVRGPRPGLRDGYVELMRRALFGSDLTLRLPQRAVSIRLRSAPLARAATVLMDVGYGGAVRLLPARLKTYAKGRRSPIP